MTLPSAIADLVQEVKRVPSLVTAQIAKWNGQVQAKIAELENWKVNLFKTKTMEVEKGSYRTIAKFNSYGLVSSFRLVISGTYRNFVFGGIYDLVMTHPSRLDIVEVVSSHYGKIKLKIIVDYRGSGHVQLMTETGNDGIWHLQIGLIPYVGSVNHTDENVDYTDKEVYEMSYE